MSPHRTVPHSPSKPFCHRRFETDDFELQRDGRLLDGITFGATDLVEGVSSQSGRFLRKAISVGEVIETVKRRQTRAARLPCRVA